MKVTVTQGIQVSFAGEVYRDGSTVEVPDFVAQRWVRNGWASTDGPQSLPDARGLNKSDAGPDWWSLGEGQFEKPRPEQEPQPVPEHDSQYHPNGLPIALVEGSQGPMPGSQGETIEQSSGPGPAKPAAKAKVTRARRDPRRSKRNADD